MSLLGKTYDKPTFKTQYTSDELRRMIDQEYARRANESAGGATLMGAPSAVFGKSAVQLEHLYQNTLSNEKQQERITELEKQVAELKNNKT